jgi:uncharacterized protein YkwD
MGGMPGSGGMGGMAVRMDAATPRDAAPPSPLPDAAPSVGMQGACSVTRPGATGKEPGGLIPVCCTPTTAEKSQIDQVFDLLNMHRMRNGVAALTYDPKLEQAIQGHCMHMATHTFFDHGAPESAVAAFNVRAQLCGAGAAGENIAAGQRSPQDVMTSWINSAGHNRNMLDPSFKRVGIGRYGSQWGQIFGR